MKILVIEDKAIHQESARKTLQGHDVTILTSFDEAMHVMGHPTDAEVIEGKDPLAFDYDVVLTGMMMPMSRKTLLRRAYVPGELVPYGFIITLRATLCGAKFVAMLTDTNHLKGAMSAALDHFGLAYYNGTETDFLINRAKCRFVHAPFTGYDAKDWGRVLKDLTAE